jgi:hypothetical protein
MEEIVEDVQMAELDDDIQIGGDDVEMGEEDGDILIAEPDEDIEMGEH